LPEEKAREKERLAQLNNQTQQRLDKETKQRQEIEGKYQAHQQCSRSCGLGINQS
jgi:hypothetical protein